MEILHGVNCIKGEIHGITTLMRLNTRWSSSRGRSGAQRFSTNNGRDYSSTSYYYEDDEPLIQNFRRLNEYLDGKFDLAEVDCVTYLTPFHEIVVAESAGGPLTSAALSSLSKFALYGFFASHFPRVKEGMVLIAKSISYCVFEETDWESDELILMKLLELSVLCYRSQAAYSLSIESAWDIFCTCKSIHEHYRATKILKNEAENALIHLTLNIFTRASQMVLKLEVSALQQSSLETNSRSQCESEFQRMTVERNNAILTPKDLTLSDTDGITCMLMNIINVVCNMLDVPKQNTEGIKLGLSLLNVALEAGGLALSSIAPLIHVLHNDVCRHLLRATQSEDLGVFSSALRVVFNLFMSIKDHMKVQLEVFLTSVHLRLLNTPSPMSSQAREELALESLLELCREPLLMQDLYINYDCDVQCTNLFDAIITSLCKRATMDIDGSAFDVSHSNGENSPTQSNSFKAPLQTVGKMKYHSRVTIVHRLAFEAIAAVLHGMSLRTLKFNHQLTLLNREKGRETPLLGDHSLTTNTVLELDDIIETEIDKWCDSHSDSDILSQEDYEVYSYLAKKNAGLGPSSPTTKATLSKIETPPKGTQENSLAPSFIRSSPISMHGKLLDGSISSDAAISIVDRENEITNSLIEKNRKAEELRRRKLMKQRLKLVSEKFNQKPLKLDWLQLACEASIVSTCSTGETPSESNYFNADPKSIAEFFRHSPGLGKQQIGEFISKGPADLYPFHAKVLMDYVRAFDFSDGVVVMSFDQALRLFLSSFRLPGEAQCIDRIMEAFSGRYFEQLGSNGPFASTDAAFILSFSTIMLNTDLHNPQIPTSKKMTKEEFIRNNRGINDKQDLPREYLESLYDKIKENQIQVDIDITDSKSAVDFTDPAAWSKLIAKVSNNQAPAQFTPTITARRAYNIYGHHSSSNSSDRAMEITSVVSYDADMFITIAKVAFQAIFVLWETTTDDMILKRTFQCIVDFYSIARSLRLVSLTSGLIRTFIEHCMRSMVQRRASNTIRPYTRQNILTAKMNYNQWSSETGHDLSVLIQSNFPDLIVNPEQEAASENEKPVDWSEATLIKGELTARLIIQLLNSNSLDLDKEAWYFLFLFLLWSRSRGALPHGMALLPNSFSCGKVPSSSSSSSSSSSAGEEVEKPFDLIRFKPTVHAQYCILGEASLLIKDTSAKRSSKKILKKNPLSVRTQQDRLPESEAAQQTSSAWFSFLWSGNQDLQSLDNHSRANNVHCPGSSGSKCVSSDEEDLLFTNANNTKVLGADRQHIRTDDWLLHKALDSSPIACIFPALGGVNTMEKGSQNEAVSPVVISALLALIQTLLHKINCFPQESIRSSDSATATDDDYSLDDLFPPTNPHQLEAVLEANELDLCLAIEWLYRFVSRDIASWREHGMQFLSLIQICLGESVDNLFKHAPFALERCIICSFRCVINVYSSKDGASASFGLHTHSIHSANVSAGAADEVQANAKSAWMLMRLIRDIPPEMLGTLADVVASGILAILQTAYNNEATFTLDHWYLLFSLLNASSSSEEGLLRTWECVGFCLDRDIVSDLNFTPCRHLALKVLNSLGDYNSYEDMNNFEQCEEFKYSLDALQVVLRLTLMAVGGYILSKDSSSTSTSIRTNQAEAASFSSTAAVPTKSITATPAKTRPRNLMSIAAHDDPRRSKSAPSFGQVKAAKSRATITFSPLQDFSSGSPQKAAIIASRSIIVSAIEFSRPEEIQAMWVSTCILYADCCHLPSEFVIEKAIYCLEMLISAGQRAEFAESVWFQIFDETLARLPINATAAVSRLAGLPADAISGISCRCCGLVFSILVSHARTWKTKEHFSAMFIRVVSSLAATMAFASKYVGPAVASSVSSASGSCHQSQDELLGMLVALFRLLQPTSSTPYKAAHYNAANAGSTGGVGSGDDSSVSAASRGAAAVSASALSSHSSTVSVSAASSSSQSTATGGGLWSFFWSSSTPSDANANANANAIATANSAQFQTPSKPLSAAAAADEAESVSSATGPGSDQLSACASASASASVSSSDSDLLILQLSWKSAVSLNPQLPAMLRSWDPTLLQAIQVAIRTPISTISAARPQTTAQTHHSGSSALSAPAIGAAGPGAWIGSPVAPQVSKATAAPLSSVPLSSHLSSPVSAAPVVSTQLQSPSHSQSQSQSQSVAAESRLFHASSTPATQQSASLVRALHQSLSSPSQALSSPQLKPLGSGYNGISSPPANKQASTEPAALMREKEKSAPVTAPAIMSSASPAAGRPATATAQRSSTTSIQIV